MNFYGDYKNPAAELNARVVRARKILERELPPLVARMVIDELSWLHSAKWANSSGRLGNVLDEIETLATVFDQNGAA